MADPYVALLAERAILQAHACPDCCSAIYYQVLVEHSPTCPAVGPAEPAELLDVEHGSDFCGAFFRQDFAECARLVDEHGAERLLYGLAAYLSPVGSHDA